MTPEQAFEVIRRIDKGTPRFTDTEMKAITTLNSALRQHELNPSQVKEFTTFAVENLVD